VGVVDTIITELCLIDVTDRGLVIRELRDGVTLEDVQKVTEPTLIVDGDIRQMAL
jgi:acyl CoA:acetate/3-ketoacid CoA transferase beta subunit